MQNETRQSPQSPAPGRKRRLLRIVIIVGAILLVLVTVVSVYVALGFDHAMFEAYYPDREFESEAWKDGGPIDRASMVRSMYSKHYFTEMTHKEITSLLGEPDRTGEFLDSFGRKRTSADYKLDRGVRSVFWPFGEPWYQYMTFEFDEDGLCTRVSENN